MLSVKLPYLDFFFNEKVKSWPVGTLTMVLHGKFYQHGKL